MPTIRTRALGGCAAAAAAVMTLAAPAASADPAGPSGPTFLVLTVQGADSDQVTALQCDPPAGRHPDPAAACAALHSVDGDIGALPPNPGILCPALHQPVTTVAAGLYRGEPVHFSRTFSNRCLLEVAADPVF